MFFSFLHNKYSTLYFRYYFKFYILLCEQELDFRQQKSATVGLDITYTLLLVVSWEELSEIYFL